MELNRIVALLALLILALVGCNRQGGDTPDATDEYADSMSTEHAADTSDPSPGAAVAPVRAVTSDVIAYTEQDNELVYGYFAAPEDMFEPLPAVIMIHEWWGLNDNVRAMADRLAAEGYIVFAVDLYGGQTAESAAGARDLMMAVDPDSARENIRAAYSFLELGTGAPKIASLGWCFGGMWSLNTAMLFPDDLDAAVIYYGSVTSEESLLRPVNAPILGLFAEDDQGIDVQSVHAFRRTLERLRKDYIVHIYPGVGHAFANPTGQRYNEEAATDAWRRTLNFLKLHLAMD